MSELIAAKELCKYFNVAAGTLYAVDKVNFSINEGETLGVVGESGCGKSTLGRVLTHLHESTSGQLIYRGKDITRVSRKELSDLRKEIQIIFQDPFASLNPRMTVHQLISEPLKLAKKYNNKEIEDKVYQMMDTVGLARRLDNAYPNELDGGRRQRICIARALVLDPKFVVCDEPVSALDVSIQAQIINLLLDIQEQKNLTYMFITHDLMVVKYISTNIMVMYLGQVVEYANNEELFEHPVHPYTQALLSAVPIPDVHHEVKRIITKGELKSPINVGAGCRFAPRCHMATEKCFSDNPVLREISEGHVVACHNV